MPTFINSLYNFNIITVKLMVIRQRNKLFYQFYGIVVIDRMYLFVHCAIFFNNFWQIRKKPKSEQTPPHLV